jgi:predicted RND superfamily exporter protein
MAVNASVLCAEGLKDIVGKYRNIKAIGLYRVLRKSLPCLLATGSTTIAGTLPFLFLQEGTNSFIRNLSLITALGVGASCICSVSFLPALIMVFRRIYISTHPELKDAGQFRLSGMVI